MKPTLFDNVYASVFENKIKSENELKETSNQILPIKLSTRQVHEIFKKPHVSINQSQMIPLFIDNQEFSPEIKPSDEMEHLENRDTSNFLRKPNQSTNELPEVKTFDEADNNSIKYKKLCNILNQENKNLKVQLSQSKARINELENLVSEMKKSIDKKTDSKLFVYHKIKNHGNLIQNMKKEITLLNQTIYKKNEEIRLLKETTKYRNMYDMVLALHASKQECQRLYTTIQELELKNYNEDFERKEKNHQEKLNLFNEKIDHLEFDLNAQMESKNQHPNLVEEINHLKEENIKLKMEIFELKSAKKPTSPYYLKTEKKLLPNLFV